MTYTMAIDIGGTMIKYGLIDSEGKLVERQEVATEAHKGGPAILDKVCGLIDQYLDRQLTGIAMSSAGMVDPVKGEIFYAGPQIPNYAGTQFKAVLEAKYGLPCWLENDVNCAGWAEATSGSAKGASVALCLTIGTGIGGSLIIDGKVFPGASYSACEVGYLPLPDGPFQDLASTTALVHYAAELHGDSPEDWDGRRIFDLAKKGDDKCLKAIDRLVDYLGQGIASICYVANPAVVVLGGGIMAQKDFLKDRLEASLKQHLISSLADKTRLAFAHHENDAGMLGAYYHFLSREAEK